ncbi:hypothetical protein I6A60_33955 [Frankia sp. AgB1.9]|uniref:hypothetical protein n=1 Tax=unclassified Frankia TaxID=2632575 RepID=UPI00193417ED|nr:MULTISPECIES: hypothetical protein [unclassified Frankia]MBL7490386.1 hypothetical protein [Frankia sp. AgW1.1]MBL7552824.1 hypothetical protein [Frankia sp. AgB1.9]MBL7619669.1 hypothetical protein [Frankia sp. AgB1.8]
MLTRIRAGWAGAAVAVFTLCSCGSTVGANSAASTSTAPRTAEASVAALSEKLDPLAFVYAQATETKSFTVTSAASAYSDMTDPVISPFRLLATCLDTTVEPPIAAGDGVALSLNDGEIAVNSSTQIVSPAQRARDDETLRDPRFASCLQQTLVDEVKSAGEPNETVHWGEVGPNTNVRIPPGASARVLFAVPILDNATNQQLAAAVIDVVFLSSGQVEDQLTVTSLSNPANDLMLAATAQVAGKLKQQ